VGADKDEPRVEVAPPAVAVARSRTASAAAWAGLAGFLAIYAIVRARLTDAFDAAMTVKFQRAAHPTLARVLRAASWPGFPPQSRVIPALIAGSLGLARLRIEAVTFLMAWGTAIIASVTKALMNRARPVAGTDLHVVTAPLGGSSFPSGHVLTYVGVYGFLAYLIHALLRPVAIRRAGVATSLVLVGLVGPSRIQQGHHWFTDVTASYLLGLSYLIGVASVYRRLKARSAGTKP
jgi:undecaprenyl-diphosphatase